MGTDSTWALSRRRFLATAGGVVAALGTRAAIVRNGRGERMPGRPMDDAGIADLLSFLRKR